MPSTAEARVCESCGAEVGAAQVCAVCGEPVLPPERRFVTVLFADLTGYTELCARLDPEDVHAFVRPVMTALRFVVESYGGTVPQIMGDGFMAVFGVPAGHEDDAERALRAAFALHEHVRRHNESADAVQVPELRIGVNSGEVLVAGSREKSGFSLHGEPVNFASRLCTMAAAGRTLASERTRELGSAAVRFGPRRQRRVRGLDGLYPVYEPVALLPATDPRPAPPFVGRAEPVAALRDVVAEAAAAGESRGVVVVGEAGVGKSRLVAEVASAVPGAVVLRGRCTPYGEQRPFSALTDAVLAHAGATPGDAGAEEAVAALVDRTVRDDVAPAVRRSLAQLVGAARPDPRGGQGDVPRAQAQALRLVVEGLAARAPVVLVLDDLQDADEHLHDLLAGLSTRPWRGPIAVLATARPDSVLPAGLPAYPLDALPRDELDELLGSLVGGTDPWLADELWARTGGNPLFCEECVRLLVEVGAVRDGVVADQAAVQAVPTSLRTLIVARLDALPADERALLRYASVTGDRTWDTLLEGTSGVADVVGTLAALEARGLLRREARSRLAGATEWGFRHTLVRDVAYSSLAYRDRAARHLATAERLAGFGAPVADLAHHYEQAWMLGGMSRETGMRAAAYLLRWGREVLAYQARSADAVFRRGLAAAAEAGLEDRLLVAELHAERATALTELQRTDEGLAEVEQVLEVAPDGPEGKRVVATALLARGRMLSYLGQVDAARPDVDRAERLFEEAGDLSGQARCLRAKADLSRYDDMGRLAETLRAAYDTYVAAGDRWGQARLAEDLAYFYTLRGGAEYAQWHREASRLAEDEADLRGQAALLRARGFYALYRGERAEAVATLGRAGERAVAAGNRWVEGDALVSEALAHAASGGLDEAAALLHRAERLADETEWPRLRGVVDVVAARVAARRGNVAEAGRRLAAARERLSGLYDLADVDGAEAEVLLDRGRWDEAGPVANRAAAPWEPLGAELYVLPLRLVPGRAALLAGAPGAAEQLAAVARRAEGSGAPRYAELAAAAAEQAALLAGAEPASAWSAQPLPETEATALENAALRGLRSGAKATAAAGFERAAAVWERLGCTVWWVRARCWAAAAEGRPDGAEVTGALVRLGAPPDAAALWRSLLP